MENGDGAMERSGVETGRAVAPSRAAARSPSSSAVLGLRVRRGWLRGEGSTAPVSDWLMLELFPSHSTHLLRAND